MNKVGTNVVRIFVIGLLVLLMLVILNVFVEKPILLFLCLVSLYFIVLWFIAKWGNEKNRLFIMQQIVFVIILGLAVALVYFNIPDIIFYALMIFLFVTWITLVVFMIINNRNSIFVFIKKIKKRKK